MSRSVSDRSLSRLPNLVTPHETRVLSVSDRSLSRLPN